jgi:hypothetical protein
MSLTNNLKKIVGAALVLSGLVFGTILLFAYIDTKLTNNLLTLFKTFYFVFVAIILGIIYLAKSTSLKTKTGHALAIIMILIFSAAAATMAGNLKAAYDTNKDMRAYNPQLQAQNDYYSQYAQALKARIDSVNLANADLEKQIINITGKITNKTPIIVENIITLPPEIIYVQDNSSANVPVTPAVPAPAPVPVPAKDTEIETESD